MMLMMVLELPSADTVQELEEDRDLPIHRSQLTVPAATSSRFGGEGSAPPHPFGPVECQTASGKTANVQTKQNNNVIKWYKWRNL